MKKIIILVALCLFTSTACGNEAKLVVPEPIEPTLEEIKKSNMEAAQMSFINIKKTAELYFLEAQLISDASIHEIRIDFSDASTIPEDFVFSGNIPSSGLVIIDENGGVTLENLVINGLTCNFNDENKVICK